MGKTNSNSIAAILISKLNYKKSGFRKKILERWELSNDDLVFYDGMYSSSGIRDLNNKKPDIIGKIGGDTCVLIEVKANLKEPLQGDSQGKNGTYQKAAQNNQLKLIYIIPDGYEHLCEIPTSAVIVFWSEIYEVAKEYDNTGFTEQINLFVKNIFHTNDLVFNKGEAVLFLDYKRIGQVVKLFSKIKGLMAEYLKQKELFFGGLKYIYDDDLGCYYKFKNGNYKINSDDDDASTRRDIWIGLGEIDGANYSFFMGPWGIESIDDEKYTLDKHFFIEQEANGKQQVYVPISTDDNTPPEFLYSEDAKDQQEKFNKLMDINIRKLLTMLKKL